MKPRMTENAEIKKLIPPFHFNNPVKRIRHLRQKIIRVFSSEMQNVQPHF